jgi:hypothetical protein
LSLHIKDIAIKLPHFFAWLLADGPRAEPHGADLHRVARFSEQAARHDLLWQVSDDHFDAARLAVDGNGPRNLRLAAIQRYGGHPPIDGFGHCQGAKGHQDNRQCRGSRLIA